MKPPRLVLDMRSMSAGCAIADALLASRRATVVVYNGQRACVTDDEPPGVVGAHRAAERAVERCAEIMTAAASEESRKMTLPPLRLKTTAFERRNMNQPFYAKIARKGRR